MGEVPYENGVPSIISMTKRKAKGTTIPTAMTVEELRLNKQLL